MGLAARPYSSAKRVVRSCSASGRKEKNSIRTSRSKGTTEIPARRIPARWRRRYWQKRGGEGGLGARRVGRGVRQRPGGGEPRSGAAPRPVHIVSTISRSRGWETLETS